MGRGAFYSPFHSMWGFGNTAATSGKSSYSSSSNFGYPPTPPKESGTPEGTSSAGQQQQQNGGGQGMTGTADEYAGHMSNNNHVVPPTSAGAAASSLMEAKPSAEHLMNSISSSLSAYSHSLPHSGSASGGRKLPEGNAAASTNSYGSSSSEAGTASSFYYPTSSDLAMYGATSGYGGVRPMQASRPKSKSRSNAGKKEHKAKLTIGGGGLTFPNRPFFL